MFATLFVCPAQRLFFAYFTLHTSATIPLVPLPSDPVSMKMMTDAISPNRRTSAGVRSQMQDGDGRQMLPANSGYVQRTLT
ncbi:hypothetical protein [Streptomyces sp. DT9]